MTSPADAGAVPESDGPPPSQGQQAAPPEDELPEWEPLTPELVEEEAQRGDAMLRNAMLLVALLLGWTQVADSSLLVRIRSGQFMAQHGFLPPGNDPFAATTDGRPWINLGWLTDLASAGIYELGRLTQPLLGDQSKLLTLWGAVAGLLAFWLVSQMRHAETPTWWNSVVATIAIVAAYPAMTAGPAAVTLVGVAILLWLLHRQSLGQRSVWPFALLLFLWSNSDPLAWFGLALLWAAAAGRQLDRLRTAEGQPSEQASLLKIAAISTVAALLHPFHWHMLESPFVLFWTELPDARLYIGSNGALTTHFRWMWFPVNHPLFWTPLDPPVIAGVVLQGVTLITLLLNSARLSMVHVAIFVVANGLSLCAGLFIPAASVLNAVLAGLNGQVWYARTFRQEYSTHWLELLYSRTGRALTVFGLFAVAYLMINGALPGIAGRRLGMGFDWRIRTANSSYRTLASRIKDLRGFNGRPDQGDFMVWAGMKPFNDSRLALYARGDENLLKLHRDTFYALQPANPKLPATGKPEVWKATFDRFLIQHVYARLTGDDTGTKHDLLLRLAVNPGLTLADVDAAAARLDRVSPDVAAEPAPHLAIDYISQVFRGNVEAVVGTPMWPRELTTYERWLIQPEPTIPADGQTAQHLAYLASNFAPRLDMAKRPGETSHAMRVAAIRLARMALQVDPNSSAVHEVLRGVYRGLLQGEQGFGILGALNELRVRQMLAADYFSLLTTAATPLQHEELAHFLASIGYRDVALEHLQIVFDRTGSWTSLPLSDPNHNQLRDQNRALLKSLEESVKEVQTNANREIERGEDPIAVARATFDAGCPQFALTILTPLETEVIRDPMASILYAQLLMAVGRMEEAWERLEGIETLFPPEDAAVAGIGELKSIWRSNTAISNMTRGDMDRAVTLWNRETRELSSGALKAALDSVPLASAPPARQDLLGLVAGRVATDILYSFPERWASTQMLIAVSEVEYGRLDKARAAIQSILETAPQSSVRPLAVYYHQLLTGESVPLAPPSPPAEQPVFYGDDGATVDLSQPAASAGSSDDRPPAPPVAEPLM